MTGSNCRCWLLVAGAAGLAAAGCDARSGYDFDNLNLLPPQEELVELSLGRYRIPIPVVEHRSPSQLVYHHRFQLDFELHALVSPKARSQVADSWARHEGKIRDRVIRVCRTATLDELLEPELATLKARLTDALVHKLGGSEVRQLLISEVVSQQL